MDRTELERELEQLHVACWGWALACCAREPEIAEESLQSAYVKILTGQAQFHGRSTLRTWVFGVIRRTAIEEMRRRKTRRLRESGDESVASRVADPAPGADAMVEQSEARAEIVSALSMLSPRQREVLELVFYHGMTIEEAAVVMRVSLGSARTHYDRGKKELALALGLT
jgi:RNA polymerase sigma-70 factor, ECF subfamily